MALNTLTKSELRLLLAYGLETARKVGDPRPTGMTANIHGMQGLKTTYGEKGSILRGWHLGDISFNHKVYYHMVVMALPAL